MRSKSRALTQQIAMLKGCNSTRIALALALLLNVAPASILAQTREPGGRLTLQTTTAVPAGGQGNSLRLCWEEHPCIRAGEHLVLSAIATFSADWWRSDVAYPEEELLIRDVARRRLGVTARVFGIVDLYAEGELADETEKWRDRYVDIRPMEVLQLRVGTFKLPFSQDETTEPPDLDFALHAQTATLLAPGRDPGVMLHGTVAHRRLGYEIGRFEHDGRNARTSDPDRVYGGPTVAGRFTVQPWSSPASPRGTLRISLAFTTSTIPEGYPSLNGRTALDLSYYSSKVLVNGAQRRHGVAAEWDARPCSAATEYLRATDERLGESVEDTDLSPFMGHGWLVSGTCAVFGARPVAGAPSKAAVLPDHGRGYLELAARYEWLRFGSVATGEASTSPRSDVLPDNGSQVLTLGANWYANRWVRVQFNAIREGITHPASGPFPDRTHIWSHVVRLQFLL